MSALSTAKRMARWGALLGLVCGMLYSFGGLFVDLLTTGLNWGTLLAFGALVGMPVILAVGGFVLGTLVGAGARAIRALRSRDNEAED